MNQPTPQGPTDDDLRAKWRAAGGGFHGPHVETGTMPEALLLPFLRSLALSHRETVTQVAEALKAAHPEVSPVTEVKFEHEATLDEHTVITRSIADKLGSADSAFDRRAFFVACGLDPKVSDYGSENLITDETDPYANPDTAPSEP